MTPKGLFSNGTFNKLSIATLVIGIACALSTAYLMTKLDTLIHVQLYNFGLQFDHAWAEPYWTYAYTMYTALALPIILSLLIMPTGIALLLSKPQGTPLINTKTTVSTHESRETNQGKKEPAQSQRQPIINQENKPAPLQSPAQQAQAANQESQPKKSQSTGTANISCSNCGRKLGRALLMLSFENGKSKLVKVCPYCNHTLGDALNEQQKLQLGSSGR